MEHLKCLPANPDISGIGVRAAIYAQNLLCFLPVCLYLWDKKISQDELAGARDQSVGMLAVAFSILITTIILAGSQSPTISSYHASIVLDLSWMNNTSTWIWFILFVHHKSRSQFKPTDATWSAWWRLLWSPIANFLQGEQGTGDRWHMQGTNETGKSGGIQRSFLRCWAFVRRLFVLVIAAPVLTLGSIHLSIMAAIGIWLWLNPANFGEPILCDLQPTVVVFGTSVDFSSTPLRIFSLAIYFLLLIPGFNLLPPFLFFLTLHIWYNWSRNRHAYFWNPCVRAGERISAALFRSKAREPSLEEAARSPVTSASNQYPPPLITPGRRTDSRAVHTAFLVVGLVFLVAINVLFIVDIELTLRRNRANQTDEERQWGFGQILALLLLVMPLRDAWNALRNIRNHIQQRFEQLFQTAADAKPLEETIKDLGELVIAGANPRKKISGRSATFLQLAAYSGNRELVDFLLSRDTDNRESVNAAGGDYGTALQAASARAHDQIIELLLDNGADGKVIGDPGDYESALWVASIKNLVTVLKTLLEGGLNANIDGRNYGSLLQAASARCYNEIVELLLDNGADVNVDGGDYGSALCASVAHGRVDIVRRILMENVNLKAIGPFGAALHVAVMMENTEMVTLLLGKNPKEADCAWKPIGTAVDLAGLMQNRMFFDLLRGNDLEGSKQTDFDDYRYLSVFICPAHGYEG